MKRIVLVSALIAGFAIPTAVYAAQHMNGGGGHGIDAVFEQHDTNKDGFITKDEMNGNWAGRFGEMDANKDGKLSKDELQQVMSDMRDNRMGMMMDRVDSDGDGQISEAEVTNFALKMFRKADGNKDGSVTMDEMGSMMMNMRGGMMGGGMGGGMHSGGMGNGMQGNGMQNGTPHNGDMQKKKTN